MKNPFRIAAVAGTLALVASACGPSGASTAPTTGPAATTATSQGPAATTAATTAPTLSGSLTIWEAYGASGTSEKDAFEKIVAQVKAANPDLKVTTLDVPFADLFNKFETSASTGEPDMYIAPNDSLPSEARNGLLADVSDLETVLKAAPYNTSDVAINAAKVDGKLYEIPESMKAVALFYRTDQFATAPATTADYLTNASKLGLVYGANGGGAYYQWGLYSSFGGKILDDAGKCAATAGGVADSLKFLADFKAAGGHLYQNDGDAKADFIAGKIGGFIDGPWMSGDLKTALGDKLAVAAGPTGPSGGAFAPMTAPDGFYINAASPNIDLAKQFALQFLLPANEQVFADAGHLPANTTLQPADPIAKAFAALMPTGYARPTLKELNNYWGNFGNAIVAVVDKGTDSTKAVTDACAAMDKANGL
ncbi:MAG TPA: extracellular solute-binding protein [Candidatus Limnocylindrales bacterium]|nr:extracellular solute-binding protein [Candidatus Limnocylindrales bacterium]